MMEKLKSFLNYYKLPLLTGIMIPTSYIPFPPWALLICYVPLWFFWLREEKLKQILIGGWIAQFMVALIGFHWIMWTAHDFGGLPWPISFLVLLAYCALGNLFIPLAGLLWHLLRKYSPTPLCYYILALITFIAEYTWPGIFIWNLGYPLLGANLPIYQLADMIGFAGLSGLILLINGLLLHTWVKRSSKKFALISLTSLLFILLILNFLGAPRAKQWQETNSLTKALIVQANIGNLEKIYAEKGRGYQKDILQKYFSLTSLALQQNPEISFIVWPETAVPENLDIHFNYKPYVTLVENYVREINKPLVTGAYSQDPPFLKKRAQTYNALFVLNERGERIALPYHKSLLLAFGEYLPFGEYYEPLKDIFPMVSDFGRGSGPTVFQLNDLKLGAEICYEGLYDNFNREIGKLGAEIIVNVTNDSWFGTLLEPYQHLYMTLGRAIELRRPLIRSTNTGVSTVILASGEILEKSPLNQEWSGVFTIPYIKNPPSTFFQDYGHLIPYLLGCILFILLLLGGLHSERFKKP